MVEGDETVFEGPITRVLDLHTFRPPEIASVVGEYLWAAQKQGFGEVRIIHGRGIGVQRDIVRGVLAKTAFVTSFADDFNGNKGATIAYLRPAETGV